MGGLQYGADLPSGFGSAGFEEVLAQAYGWQLLRVHTCIPIGL
jgi:hypothetical protein